MSIVAHVRGARGVWSTVEIPEGEVLSVRDTLRDLVDNTIATEVQFGGESPENPPEAPPPVLHREPEKTPEPVAEFSEEPPEEPEQAEGEDPPVTEEKPAKKPKKATGNG